MRRLLILGWLGIPLSMQQPAACTEGHQRKTGTHLDSFVSKYVPGQEYRYLAARRPMTGKRNSTFSIARRADAFSIR